MFSAILLAFGSDCPCQCMSTDVNVTEELLSQAEPKKTWLNQYEALVGLFHHFLGGQIGF